MQQEIDDDNLNDEVPRVTKAQETFNDIPNPTPAEIGRMLSGRIDYVQSRHAHHFDEMERRIAVNNNVQLARMQEMINDSNNNLKATFGAEMIRILKENNVIVTESPTMPQSPMLPYRQKPQIQESDGDDDDHDDHDDPPIHLRGSKAGRHHRGDRHPRFEDHHHRPLSPLGFPQDTPLPRHPTVPVSPPPKPDRLRS